MWATHRTAIAGALPRPVPNLATLEARAGVTAELGAPATVRQFDLDLVAHEVAFMVFRHALFRSLAGVELNESEANLKLDLSNVSNLAEAALEILLTRMLGETADVDFVRLDDTFLAVAVSAVARASVGHVGLAFPFAMVALIDRCAARWRRVARTHSVLHRFYLVQASS